jgi:hypothetical protein
VGATQFLIGVSGALVGVIGWLMVGLYIQHRTNERQARDAGRAVYFELGANRMALFIASEYGVFGPLNRATFDRLLPELSTWLPADELQALVIAYLGHAGYEQAANDREVPAEVRKAALSALLEAHRVALELIQRRVFSKHEIASLNRYVSPEYMRLIEAAGDIRQEEDAS